MTSKMLNANYNLGFKIPVRFIRKAYIYWCVLVADEPPPNDPYLPNPCHNGGNCSSSAGEFTCSCASGYTGDNCSTSTLQGRKLRNTLENMHLLQKMEKGARSTRAI